MPFMSFSWLSANLRVERQPAWGNEGCVFLSVMFKSNIHSEKGAYQ